MTGHRKNARQAGSRLFRGLAQLFKLLPDVFRNGAQPLSILAIYLASNALQLGNDALLLCGLSLTIGYNAHGFCFLPLGLGSPPVGFVSLWVAHACTNIQACPATGRGFSFGSEQTSNQPSHYLAAPHSFGTDLRRSGAHCQEEAAANCLK